MNLPEPHASRDAPGATVLAPAAGCPWKPWARVAASLAVVWHLVGVMVAPISVPPQFNGGDSVLGAELKKVYGPYITAANLDHSYKFFAPNPGPSHLVRYDLYFADGSKRVNQDDQILPNRTGHWPRLLYHRHFMLTEFMNFPPMWDLGGRPLNESAGGEPSSVPPGVNPRAGGVATLGQAEQLGPVGPLRPTPLAPPNPTASGTADIEPMADLLERLHQKPPNGTQPDAGRDFGPLPYMVPYWRAAAAYLARRHGAVRVDLFFREHGLPTVEQFKEAKRLDPPEAYRERLLVSYRTEEGK